MKLGEILLICVYIFYIVHVMLCYVMLCYVMLCYVMLCYVMLCYVMLCYVCYVMLCLLCYVMLCYVMLLCYVVMLCCYVMLLCYVMLCHVISHTTRLTTPMYFDCFNNRNFCYTIQLMHYSRFKTHSLQHLNRNFSKFK